MQHKTSWWPDHGENSDLISDPLPTLHSSKNMYLNILHLFNVPENYIDWTLLPKLGRLFLHVLIGLCDLVVSLTLKSGALMIPFKLHRAQRNHSSRNALATEHVLNPPLTSYARQELMALVLIIHMIRNIQEFGLWSSSERLYIHQQCPSTLCLVILFCFTREERCCQLHKLVVKNLRAAFLVGSMVIGQTVMMLN